jgi:membrane associated rhomboid family serine protease
MRVEDLDKICTMRNVTRNGKTQLYNVSFFSLNFNRWRSCLQNVSYVFRKIRLSIMAAYHAYMHGGYMHIFFNMFALYSFGSALESFGK